MERKYIVDIAGGLPVILMELNQSGTVMKTYIYANSQIIAHELGHAAFVLEDLTGADTSNLMHQTATCPKRLRKGQWVTIQSFTPPAP